VASSGASVANSSGTSNISTSVSLVPGATVTFTVVAQIASSATGNLVNTVTVTPPMGVTDTNPSNNTATDTDTLALGSISGTKYLDATGNGFGGTDAPLSGVKINLYKDLSGNGVLGTGDGSPVATATTAANGTYSFPGLAAGTYFVQEVVPSGYVQTGGGPNGSAGNTYYTVTVASGQTNTGKNFDDFQVPTCTPTNVSFTVNNNNYLTTVTSLSGNTQQGDTVTVTFTVTAGMSDQLTLVSYIAPSSTFSDSNAYQQVIYQQATGIFASGTHSLTVAIPNSYYQIDFVCGAAINQLEPNQNGNAYGPDSANILYHAEGRYIDSDGGGTTAFTTKTVASGDFATVSPTNYWSTTTGQNVIKSLNGGSTATKLAQWLATSFPNLYGSGAGSHSLVNSNGTYFTNSQVASAYLSTTTFTSGDRQVLSAALSVYATSINLAGTNVHNTDSHITTSLAGSGMDTYNVGVNGSAFGVPNSTTLTVMQFLTDLNASTSAGAGVASGGNAVFSGINVIGNVTNATLTSDGLAYTPAQIRTAYGINNLALDGTGQTIAIVDAYDNPNIFESVDTFSSQFGLTSTGSTLYDQYGPASSFLTVLNQNGDSTSLPGTDPAGAGNDNWEVEEALDVEWVHAIAPGAQIVLVEANSQALSDLMASAATAANQPGVSVVSMSWGFPEGQSVLAQDEATYDSDLTTPAGHQGVTFVASTGDYGTNDPEYPAFSPNVVAVGGSSLYLNADNSYSSETGWGYNSAGQGTLIGSGGGVSQYEVEPAYQQGVQGTGYRTTPDVSFVADPATGVWIADAYNSPDNPYEIVGGTSVSSPAMAATFALVNQGRVAAGEATLNSTSPTEAQQDLYSLPQSDYNSITSGTNGGYNAAAGYNLVTGLGTPVANQFVADLVAGNFPSSGQVAPIGASLNANAGYSGSAGNGTTNVMNVFAALTTTAPGRGTDAGSVVNPYVSTGNVGAGLTTIDAGPDSLFAAPTSATGSLDLTITADTSSALSGRGVNPAGALDLLMTAMGYQLDSGFGTVGSVPTSSVRDRAVGDSLFQSRDFSWSALSLHETASSFDIRQGGNHESDATTVSALDDLFGQASFDDWMKAV
jgi:hypothetical protein